MKKGVIVLFLFGISLISMIGFVPAETNIPLACTDSDGGQNYNVNGIVNYGNWTRADRCGSFDGNPSNDLNDLNEFYCRSDGEPVEEVYKCPNGCKDGACVQETDNTSVCTDSDGGNNVYKKGETTETGIINKVTSDSCVVWTGKSTNLVDYTPVPDCSGSMCFLFERLCEGGVDSSKGIKGNTGSWSCPNGCKDGACISSGSTCSSPICASGISARDTGQKDENNCPILTCYSGYNLATDKKEYGENDIIYLKISGGTGKINVYLAAPSKDSVIIMKDVLIDKQNTVKINIPDYRNIFYQSGQYLIGTSASGEKLIGGVNTNSVVVDVKIVSDFYVKEQDQCGFKNSNGEQKCYTAEENSRASCSGKDSCVADIKGYKGEKIIWKSSCGGYAYSVIDGNNEYIEFDCGRGVSNASVIQNKGFRYSYWQCYDGTEEKQGGESSCKLSETWQKYANDFCQGHCYKDQSKCGVNSFSVNVDCYTEEVISTPTTDISNTTTSSGDEVTYTISNKTTPQETSPVIPEGVLICKDSCPLDGKCYPFGYRKSGEYCTDKGSFENQLKSDNKCENNFECSSNVCVSGNCISEGFLNKIMNWFKKMFGGN